jgi:hypothetical protein
MSQSNTRQGLPSLRAAALTTGTGSTLLARMTMIDQIPLPGSSPRRRSTTGKQAAQARLARPLPDDWTTVTCGW